MGLRIMMIGAHPDDPEWYAGGTAALYARQGHSVRLVSLTNGDSGRRDEIGVARAHQRSGEAQASAASLGADYVVLANHDGSLEPSFEMRCQVIRLLREFGPDLVACHRPYDYHPDHRYTGQLVHDAAFQSVCDGVLSDVPALPRMPVVVYFRDEFRKPYPFQADVVVGIDSTFEAKIAALHCHGSQFYESAPSSSAIPANAAGRRAWLREQFAPDQRRVADLYRQRLIELYGRQRGRCIEFAEAFEACEYGAPLQPEDLPRLFPFLG